MFIGASVDGFIARENGDLDWLEVKGDSRGEDYGYEAFVGEIDAIVMGRKTFEKAVKFKPWPYGKMPVVVLSTKPLAVPPALRKVVATMADRPGEIMQRLGRLGLRRLYIDGGRTIQGFLRAGLVDEITISRVPVLLGSGVPLFGALQEDVKLRHVETKEFRSGLVQTTYAVERGAKANRPAPTETLDERDLSWRAFIEGMGVAKPAEPVVARAHARPTDALVAQAVAEVQRREVALRDPPPDSRPRQATADEGVPREPVVAAEPVPAADDLAEE